MEIQMEDDGGSRKFHVCWEWERARAPAVGEFFSQMEQKMIMMTRPGQISMPGTAFFSQRTGRFFSCQIHAHSTFVLGAKASQGYLFFFVL